VCVVSFYLFLFICNLSIHHFKVMGRPWLSGVVEVVDFKQLTPHRCGFDSRQGLWILSCEEAIQLAYRTSAVLLRCPFVPEIMHEGHLRSSSTSKAGTSRYDLYSVDVT
jgi:hypothetical protein